MNNPATKVVIEALYGDLTYPERATAGAVGYDVRAYVRGRTIETILDGEVCRVEVSNDILILRPGERAVIPLGFRAKMPVGVEAQLRLRSSVAFRKGLFMPNAPATVDPDYPGEWVILVANLFSSASEIRHLERIAQIVFARYDTVHWQSGVIGAWTDRTGGLGSTGDD